MQRNIVKASNKRTKRSAEGAAFKGDLMRKREGEFASLPAVTRGRGDILNLERLTCDVSLPLVGALLVGVGRRHALRRVLSLQAAGHGPREVVPTYAVQLGPPSGGTAYRCDDGRAGLGRPRPRLARVELPVGPLVNALALLVLSVVARVGGVRRRRHQAGAGEVRVGQEVGLLVEGERGLLVGGLQIGPRVGVPHAAPDGAAGVGAPHAAAGWLIHDDARIPRS
ncbi:hypothetical protein EYF80_004801 [Liparis tanakae]|uniref:Uncharacterized protein n=1 Tax=Liparis tanakae TaxID=230148 RepID=A0A4Z2J3I2_9TELE|nr:hypothetical protein EYF80_004801 [Liparis tanakae]